MSSRIQDRANATLPGVMAAGDQQARAPTPRQNVGAITLAEALTLAQANSPDLQAAVTAAGVAHATRLGARSVLLPSLTSVNTYTYTQRDNSGTGSGRYIASNGVHEFLNQADVHQQFGVTETAGYRSASAGEDMARAEIEIATRGLVVTVVRRFDAVVVAQRKSVTAQQAESDATRFLLITQNREAGGEAAHADVIKAQIQLEQRQRELREAGLALATNRNELAILIFPTYDTAFAVADDLATPAPLPAFDAVQARAALRNPVIAAAQAALRQASQDVWAARGELLPSLGVDYLYGIDARNFALSTNGLNNIGSSVIASVNVPLWNWGASQSRIAAARLREKQTRVELAFAERQVLADLHSFYEEAQAARDELDSLRRSVDLASDSLRLTTLRYQAGESTVLEVVDAQTTLVTASYAYDDGQARYHLALANLQTLTGIL